MKMTQNLKILNMTLEVRDHKKIINKAQEVRIDEKFKDDSDYGQFVKKRKVKRYKSNSTKKP